MWFEEQIKQREINDNQAFSGVFGEIAGEVLGKKRAAVNDDEIADSVIDEILRYYKIDFDSEKTEKEEKSLLDDEKMHENPMEGMDEKLQVRLEPYGILFRRARLEKGWEKSAIGPMIGSYDGRPAAFIPNKIKGYTLRDAATGNKIKIKGSETGLIGEDVYCFYEPLPGEVIKPVQLLKFAFKSVTGFDIFAIVLLTLLSSLILALLPVASNYLFSNVAQSSELSGLAAVGTALICLTISNMMLDGVKLFVDTRIGVKQGVAVDSAIMMRTLAMPISFYRDFSSGEITKIIGYAGSLCQNIKDLILTSSLTFIFSFVQLFVMRAYAPQLIWIVISVMLANIILSLITMRLYMAQDAGLMKAYAKEYGVGYALMSGIQKIKLAGAEKRAFAKWGRYYAKKAGAMYNPPLLMKIEDVLIMAISFAGMIFIYIEAYKSGITPARYYAFDSSYGIFMAAVWMIADATKILASIKPTVEMIKPVLETVPETGGGKEIVKSLRGKIELNHVSFTYGPELSNVINDLSLTIKAGEYVAIVGTTGCGKSTLIRLLLGLEHPTGGSIYYDSYDINAVDIQSLRRKIGSVTQSGKLITDSIYANIVINAPQIGIEGAWEAAELADIADEIRKLPMGMHTLVSEGGGGLSGGQRQRIMIARALAAKPKILIFDEATSALDNVAQKKVSDAIDGLNCTRIVVAHRLSTIKNCDRIFVLDKGSVTEEGSYDELIQKQGVFAKLVERQRLDA